MRRLSVVLTTVILAVVGALAPLPAAAAPTPVPDPPTVPLPVAESTTYRSVRPARIIDTRRSLGGTAAPAGGSRTLKVTGQRDIPEDAAAVALVVTVVSARSGVMTVYPAGRPRPGTSNLNFVAGHALSNQVVLPPGAGGAWTFTNSASVKTDIIVDVEGYFVAGAAVPGGFVPVPAQRVMDTRTGLGGTTPVARSTVDLQLTGRGGIPASGVAAVMMNVTAAYPQRTGHLAVYPTGTAVPNTSTLNFRPGAAVPNFALTKLGPDGRVRIENRSSGSTPVVVDVAGYILAGTPASPGAYVALPPTRVADTRRGFGFRRLGAEASRGTEVLPGPYYHDPDRPYAMTVTATNSTAASYLGISATVVGRPSSVQHRPGLTATGSGFGRAVNVYNRAGSVDVVVDVGGYFVSSDGGPGGAGGSLTGRVTAPGGQPVPLVSVYTADCRGCELVFPKVRTDSDGRFWFGEFPGDAYVCVSPGDPPGAPYLAECFENHTYPLFPEYMPQDADPVPVVDGATTRVDFELAPS